MTKKRKKKAKKTAPRKKNKVEKNKAEKNNAVKVEIEEQPLKITDPKEAERQIQQLIEK